MSTYIDTLNESAVVYVRDLAAYGWDIVGGGYEAYSPAGEIRAFTTYRAAQTWRLAEVRAFAEWITS